MCICHPYGCHKVQFGESAQAQTVSSPQLAAQSFLRILLYAYPCAKVCKAEPPVVHMIGTEESGSSDGKRYNEQVFFEDDLQGGEEGTSRR